MKENTAVTKNCAAGQLGNVDNSNQSTSYGYDATNNLTNVTQGTQTEIFTGFAQ